MRLVYPNLGGITPTSARIIQGVSQIPRSLRNVYIAKVVLVDDNTYNSGRRFDGTSEKSKKWGGKRTKKELTAEEILDNNK